MKETWLVMHPVSHHLVWGYDSKEKATRAAIARNRKDPEHPSYLLIYCNGRKSHLVGCLWRAFGNDFSFKECWR